MAHVQRVFRVFVSSTFSDLVAERNALQERVFPQLQEFYRQHEARFQAVRLREAILEVGKEALWENPDWVQIHRERALEVPDT